MLGWEYPPHISGGLGTACEGLTRGLARQGVEVLFMVPRVFGDEDSSHMTLIDPLRHSVKRRKGAGPSSDSQSRVTIEQLFSEAELQEIFIPAFLQPYWSEKEYSRQLQLLRESSTIESLPLELSSHRFLSSSALQYGSDIFEEVNRYAAVVSRTARYLDFDLVHAHDWMTFLAGTLVSRQSGKPLVVHIHSLEYDRSGQAGNRRIHDLEKLGIVSADAVIAVSHYTKELFDESTEFQRKKFQWFTTESTRQKPSSTTAIVVRTGASAYFFSEELHFRRDRTTLLRLRQR